MSHSQTQPLGACKEKQHAPTEKLFSIVVIKTTSSNLNAGKCDHWFCGEFAHIELISVVIHFDQTHPILKTTFCLTEKFKNLTKSLKTHLPS